MGARRGDSYTLGRGRGSLLGDGWAQEEVWEKSEGGSGRCRVSRTWKAGVTLHARSGKELGGSGLVSGRQACGHEWRSLTRCGQAPTVSGCLARGSRGWQSGQVQESVEDVEGALFHCTRSRAHNHSSTPIAAATRTLPRGLAPPTAVAAHDPPCKFETGSAHPGSAGGQSSLMCLAQGHGLLESLFGERSFGFRSWPPLS